MFFFLLEVLMFSSMINVPSHSVSHTWTRKFYFLLLLEVIVNTTRLLWINLLILCWILALVVLLPSMIVSVCMFVVLEGIWWCWKEAKASLIGREENFPVFLSFSLSLFFFLKKFSLCSLRLLSSSTEAYDRMFYYVCMCVCVCSVIRSKPKETNA